MREGRKAVDVDAVTKYLADSGNLIESGWIGMRMTILRDAPEIQVNEMRKAFFSGAQHLFACIMSVMEDGTEPTENDLRRMEMIHVELEAFCDSLKREARGIAP